MSLRSKDKKLLIVQVITISRAIAALAFISIAFVPRLTFVALGLYVYACLSDLLDGFLARRLSSATQTGGVLDLFGDKYLTIIALLYAAVKGVPMLPCAIAILREVFLLSVRSIVVNGQRIFPPQRTLGTLTIIPIWTGTGVLLLYPSVWVFDWRIVSVFYWAIGLFALLNLLFKLYRNWHRLIQSFEE